jgi:DNA-binding response OmpR family regulator
VSPKPLAGTGRQTARVRVLVVEDDESMCVALNDGFRYEGYDVILAKDGEAALAAVRAERPDLVILDVMLPKMNGLDVCRSLRAQGNRVPIIMLTARGQEIDKVRGLKLGADDYVTKPFGFMELMARVEALLRRCGSPDDGAASVQIGDVEVDFRLHQATKGGKPLELSAREFQLLAYFAGHRGEVVTREELLDAVWGYDTIPFTRTVDMHVAKLRKKIEERPSEPVHLVTVHRLGYKLNG